MLLLDACYRTVEATNPDNFESELEWIEDFEEETSYFEKTEIKDKVSALKTYGGSEIKKLAEFCTTQHQSQMPTNIGN